MLFCIWPGVGECSGQGRGATLCTPGPLYRGLERRGGICNFHHPLVVLHISQKLFAEWQNLRPFTQVLPEFFPSVVVCRTKEDKMRNKPGFEHLNESLHVLVEADLPANIIGTQLIHAREILHELLKPLNETFDLVKKAQLHELAIVNGTLREESPVHTSGAASPFNIPGMKHAKTRR